MITKHINNLFNEGELDKKSNVHFLHIANSDKPVAFYNLDVIISVGYRIKSQRGTEFRIWAREVIKDYLLNGYAINKRIENLEYRVANTEKQIDFIVRTELPPREGIFYDGQIFDAYAFVSKCQNHDFNMIFMITLILLLGYNPVNHINPINQGSDKLIDNEVYLFGHSFKDLGKKLFGFIKMELSASEFLMTL